LSDNMMLDIFIKTLSFGSNFPSEPADRNRRAQKISASSLARLRVYLSPK
jgi:hypothetical protein